MAQKRSYTNPTPKTESARAAVRAFFCDMCQKGYARMNELDAHLSSYDHAHQQRLLDLKKLQSDPRAAEKQRRADRKEMKDMKPLNIKLEPKKKTGGGFTKIEHLVQGEKKEESGGMKGFTKIGGAPAPNKVPKKLGEESDTDDGEYEYYDPRKPTGCDGTCRER